VKGADVSRAGLFRRFLRESLRPYVALQIEIFACLAIGVALELADPLLLRAIIDRALGDGDRSALWLFAGLLALVFVFRTAFRLLNVWLYSYAGLRVLFDLRRRVFEHALKLSPYFFRGERQGDILARMTADVDVLQQTAAFTVVNAAHDILTIGGIVALLLWLDPLLTVALAAAYPLLIVAVVRVNRRLREQGLAVREAYGGLFTFLEERLSGVRLIQEFRREKTAARGHVEAARPLIDSNIRLSMLGAGQIALADMVATIAFVLVFLLGGARTLSGALSLGSLVAFYTLASRLFRPVSQLIDVNVNLQLARAALARIYELLDEEPAIHEKPGATAPHPIAAAAGSVADPIDRAPARAGAFESRSGASRGRLEQVSASIAWSRVSVAWPDGTPALVEVDIAVEPGQIVAVVGPSGSGKSTLAALAPRFLDPHAGAVVVSGQDARDWPLHELRRTIGLVPQETILFHDTIAANLRLARQDATDPELAEALETAGLGGFMEGLPDGLKTIVGEQGLRLSGGERQRLALARMILKDPLIYLLDEATSALDPRTERQVLERVLSRARGRTVIVIAHRLTSVTGADRIFVLDQGRLVESGSHDELYRLGGLYRRLFDDQERHVEAGA
jgi:ATP-binding cassette subfamily B protein